MKRAICIMVGQQCFLLPPQGAWVEGFCVEELGPHLGGTEDVLFILVYGTKQELYETSIQPVRQFIEEVLEPSIEDCEECPVCHREFPPGNPCNCLR